MASDPPTAAAASTSDDLDDFLSAPAVTPVVSPASAENDNAAASPDNAAESSVDADFTSALTKSAEAAVPSDVITPPMPTCAPPVPPPVEFDPLAPAPAPAAVEEEQRQQQPPANQSKQSADADLLGTGDVPPPSSSFASDDFEENEDDDDAEDSSEYETETDDDDDDDLVVGFPARTYSSDEAEDAVLLDADDAAGFDGAANIDQEQSSTEYEEPNDNLLRPGDHVYSWVKRQQRHGIVLSVGDGLLSEVDPNDCNMDAVTIVSFYNKSSRDKGRGGRAAAPGEDSTNVDYRDHDVTYTTLATGDASDVEDVNTDDGNLLAGRQSGDDEGGGEAPSLLSSTTEQTSELFASDVTAVSLATFCGNNIKKNAVRKVRYGSNFAKRLLSRPGSVTAVKADVPGLVLTRVKFLLDNPDSLPPYHRMAANGECVAVFCRIGRFITLQGSSILQIMFFGQAGGAVAGGVVASNVMLWSPMPGLWGAVGWWWYVPATVAYPFLIPILVTFGLASLLPLELLRRYRNKWKKHTQDLNRHFWMQADEETKVEYFGTTATADEDWVKKFFGGKDEDAQDEAEHGQYMPVGEGGDKDDEDGDDELERKYSENMASAYRADFGESEQEDGRLKMQMNGLLQRWNQSLRGNRNMAEEDLRGDDAVPLSSGVDTPSRQQQRPSLMKKWRDSWTNRGNGSQDSPVHARKGVDLGTYKDYDDDDIPASQGLMS